MNDEHSNLGILAFGSLIDNPGSELEKFIIGRIADVETPFPIEYGRKSSKRGNAPTLIPVSEGGAKVNATLLLLSDELPIQDAKNMLYRREINNIGSDGTYRERENPTPNQLVIEEHTGTEIVKIALTANYGCNLDEIHPEILADLAIESYESDMVERARDGISYLYNNISNGIITPLTEAYKNHILQKMDAKSLQEILDRN